MLKRKVLQVGETEVAIVMIPARQAFSLSKDVAQVAAQIFGVLGKLGTGPALEADLAVAGPQLGQALSGIDSARIDTLTEGLLAKSEAKVNGVYLPLLSVVDDVFAGRVMDLYSCLFEAVKLNFPDFFDRLAAKSPAPSQPARPQ